MTTENGSVDTGNPADNNGGAEGNTFDFGTAVETVEDEELRGWIQNKGFDGVDKMATSYRNLEQMYGADKAGRTIIRPGDDASEEEVAKFYNSLGRPENPDGYGIEVPEGADPKFAETFSGVFHEAGLTPDQVNKIAGAWGEYSQGFATEQTEQYQHTIEQDNDVLQKEWGAAYDKNVGVAKAAAKEFGLDEGTVDKLESAMGFGGLMRFMHKIGSKIGDDSYEGSDNRSDGFSPLEPGQAMAQISELKNDPGFRQRLMSGDKDAQNKWDRLNQSAYGSHG